MAKWKVGLSAALPVAAWIVATQQNRPVVTQAAEPDEAAFLVRFGAVGTGARAWDGSARIEGGRILGLEGWQFGDGDQVLPNQAWKCSTRQENYWYAPWERDLFPTKNRSKLTAKGVVLRTTLTGRVTVETPEGAFAFSTSEVSWSNPKEFAGGDVMVSRVPASTVLTPGPANEDYPALWQARDGKMWLAYQAYEKGGDRLWVRRGIDAEPEALTDAGEDLFRPVIAGNWVVWAAYRNDWELYGRRFDGKRWSEAEKLTENPGPDIFHALAEDAKGRVYLAWQSFRNGQSDIYLRVHDGRRWSPELRVSEDPANDWEPALSATGDGRAVIVWDTYGRGNYDVVLRRYERGTLGAVETLAGSAAFETRPVAAYDNSGRLWVAWDEGDPDWGKDYALGVKNAGIGLLMRRQVRVAAFEGGQWRQLPGDLTASLPEEERQVFQRPALAFDGGGNPWIFFRYRTNTPQRGGAFRCVWRLGAASFQNGRWTSLIAFPAGYGRQDAGFAAAVRRDGAIDVVWNSDGRLFLAATPKDQDLHRAVVAAGPRAGKIAWTPLAAPDVRSANPHPGEAAAVGRLRQFRASLDGKTFRIARGDMHRHTDLSWDGNRDGTLFDAYRYALDAAAFEYMGVADHQAGETEYSWWMIQKAVRLFTVPGRFAPLYGYERSLSYPNGHRNVMFAQPGVPVFPIPEAERKGQEGAAKLFEHLRATGGISMPHTSATGAGTDFRDADAAVEPLVEIYQGYRHNYEHAGAPRSEAKVPRPAGLIWSAWAKGLKIGVQSSSDHVSTHTSYAALYVTDLTREALLEAIRARRAYAATDNILVDFRVNGRMMGEAFASNEPPRLTARIIGTGPIQKVEVIRNNQYLHTQAGTGAEMDFTYVDNQPPAGENYYYIRVEQADGQLAWASPVWVRRN